jgi:hypothetical protein
MFSTKPQIARVHHQRAISATRRHRRLFSATCDYEISTLRATLPAPSEQDEINVRQISRGLEKAKARRRLSGGNARVVMAVSGERRCNRALPRRPGTWSEVGEPSTRIAKAGLFLFQRGAALGACDKEEARWRMAVNVATYPVLLWQQKAPVAKAAGA